MNVIRLWACVYGKGAIPNDNIIIIIIIITCLVSILVASLVVEIHMISSCTCTALCYGDSLAYLLNPYAAGG